MTWPEKLTAFYRDVHLTIAFLPAAAAAANFSFCFGLFHVIQYNNNDSSLTLFTELRMAKNSSTSPSLSLSLFVG